jgi:hypothetical protein
MTLAAQVPTPAITQPALAATSRQQASYGQAKYLVIGRKKLFNPHC